MSRSRTSSPKSYLFALFFTAFLVLPGLAAVGSAATPAQLLSLGKCLSVDDAGTDGSAAVLSSCAGRTGQSWQLPPRGFSGPIVGPAGKCLDVTGNDPADRTPIILFSCHGLPNQVWRHETDGRVVGLGGKCLDVLGSNNTDGTQIVLFPCNSTPNQLWTAQQRNYFQSEPMLSEAWLTALAASPQKPDRIFAAASTNGILRSENGGLDWAGAHSGVNLGTGVHEVAVDPLRADEVYALENGRLLRSSDGGRHFLKYPNTPGGLRHIAIDPHRAGHLIVLDGNRLFESGDGGRYFDQRDFPFQQSSDTLQQLVFDPQIPNRWWIAAAATCAFCTGPDQGVFRSDNQGTTWTRVFTLATQRVVADPNAGHIYALVNDQLHRSTNNGTTWQLLGVFPAALLDVWVDSAFPGRIVVAHQKGLARSSDGGASFVPVTLDPALRGGPSGTPVEIVRRLLYSGGRLLAAVDAIDGHPGRGVIASTDFGATWTLRNQRLFAAGHIADLDAVPGQNKTLWVTTREGVFQSTDGGVRFSRKLATTGPGEATALLVDPYDPSGQTLFVTSTRFPGPADRFLWKSTNGGTSWTSVASNFGQQIETGGFLATRVAGKRTYMTTLSGRISSTDYQGLLVSDDEGGTSWKPLDLGVQVRHLAKSDNDLVLFAAGDGGLVRTLDGWQSWEKLWSEKVAALSTRGAELHFLTETAYCSSPDRGQVITCYPLPRAVRGPQSVLVAGGLSYVGDRAGGVFVSTDLGRSWTAVDLGLPQTLVNVMMADPQNPARLYVGTAGAGLHQTLVSLPEAPLRFAEGRFTATITWRDFVGATGSGRAKSWTEDSGYFWFFDPSNVEVMVKVLDGRDFNDNYWVFVGSLSNVEFELTLRDEWTGRVRVYRNPLGNFASFGDLDAFPGGVTNAATTGTPVLPEASFFRPDTPTLEPEATQAAPVILGGNRFAVTVTWDDGFGQMGEGVGVTMSGDTAAFSFFSPNNTELVIKVLDGRPINGHFWVFYGALSNVGYTISVRDLITGQLVIYQNPVGNFASVGDITAF